MFCGAGKYNRAWVEYGSDLIWVEAYQGRGVRGHYCWGRRQMLWHICIITLVMGRVSLMSVGLMKSEKYVILTTRALERWRLSGVVALKANV